MAVPGMSFNRIRARELCTEAEYGLFKASLSEELKALTPEQLHSRIQRARELHEKYRAIYQRLRLPARERIGCKSPELLTICRRTQTKAILFGEALDRLESRAARLSAAASRQPHRATEREMLPPRPAGWAK
jgi:hypothetical protein